MFILKFDLRYFNMDIQAEKLVNSYKLILGFFGMRFKDGNDYGEL